MELAHRAHERNPRLRKTRTRLAHLTARERHLTRLREVRQAAHVLVAVTRETGSVERDWRSRPQDDRARQNGASNSAGCLAVERICLTFRAGPARSTLSRTIATGQGCHPRDDGSCISVILSDFMTRAHIRRGSIRVRSGVRTTVLHEDARDYYGNARTVVSWVTTLARGDGPR